MTPVPRLAESQAIALLRSLDDGLIEHPHDFDLEVMTRHVRSLVSFLTCDFGAGCSVEEGIQDANLFTVVTIPRRLTETGDDLRVHLSNFYPLATATVTNPGVWSTEECELLLAERDATRLRTALDAGGFVAVPEDVLWTGYDGPVTCPRGGPDTWWARYFDWV